MNHITDRIKTEQLVLARMKAEQEHSYFPSFHARAIRQQEELIELLSRAVEVAA